MILFQTDNRQPTTDNRQRTTDNRQPTFILAKVKTNNQLTLNAFRVFQ